MSNKSLEDSILNELQQLKGLAQRFKAAEEAYQNAIQLLREKVSDIESIAPVSEQLKAYHIELKKEIDQDRMYWVENLEQRFQQIIKGLEIQLNTEGLAVTNRQELTILKVQKEQQLAKQEKANQSLIAKMEQVQQTYRRQYRMFLILWTVLAILIVAHWIMYHFLA